VGRLDSVLSAGLSINMYMFHGGTTRGFMNGANYNDKDPYEPQISSYDYDAPLDEAGNATDKYNKFREVIQKHLACRANPTRSTGSQTCMIAVPAIKLTQTAGLFDMLPAAKISKTPLTFEDLNQAYGFVLYRTVLTEAKTGAIKVNGLRDYGIVFVNGKRVGIFDRRLKQDSLLLLYQKAKYNWIYWLKTLAVLILVLTC
jgi:beta-galactosidase